MTRLCDKAALIQRSSECATAQILGACGEFPYFKIYPTSVPSVLSRLNPHGVSDEQQNTKLWFVRHLGNENLPIVGLRCST